MSKSINEDQVEGIFKRVMSWVVSRKDDELTNKEKSVKDLIAKFDMRPSDVSKLEDVQKDGADIKKAYDYFLEVIKSLNIKMGDPQIGTTILSVVRCAQDGNFGTFPTPELAWGGSSPNISKSQQQQAQQSTQGSGQVDINKALLDLMQDAEEKEAAIKQLQVENEQLRNARGIRKSTDDIPLAASQQQQPQQSGEFDSADWGGLEGMSQTKDAPRILKAMGYEV